MSKRKYRFFLTPLDSRRRIRKTWQEQKNAGLSVNRQSLFLTDFSSKVYNVFFYFFLLLYSLHSCCHWVKICIEYARLPLYRGRLWLWVLSSIQCHGIELNPWRVVCNPPFTEVIFRLSKLFNSQCDIDFFFHYMCLWREIPLLCY